MSGTAPYYTQAFSPLPGRCFRYEAIDASHASEFFQVEGLMIDEGGGMGDQVFESNGVKLFVDPISVRYLGGAEVDFVDTVTGGGFTIKNPNATSTCGCGSSLGGTLAPRDLRVSPFHARQSELGAVFLDLLPHAFGMADSLEIQG